MIFSTRLTWLPGVLSVVLVSSAFGQQRTVERADRDAALAIHNKARAEVGVPPLELSDELAKSAQAYADELARKDEGMKHSHLPGVGENLSIYSSTSPLALQRILGEIAQRSANGWLSEKGEYIRLGEPAIQEGQYPGQREQIAHYTQLVWRETTHIGFGAAMSKSLRIYVVAHYSPQGNYVDRHPYKPKK